MTGTDLIDYFLKWFIPFACAGLFALLVKPLFQTWILGRKTQAKREWDDQAKDLKDLLGSAIQEHNEIKEHLEKVVEKSKKVDQGLREDLDDVSSKLATEIKESTAGVRNAVMAIHLRNLITDSKTYIERGWISIDEWENYNSRYDTYKELGGNGHMDPWYPKVKALPNLPPHE